MATLILETTWCTLVADKVAGIGLTMVAKALGFQVVCHSPIPGQFEKQST